MRRALIVLCTLAAAAPALAQPDQTERKSNEAFLTDLAQLQQAGQVQLLSGMHWDRGDSEAGFRTPLDVEVGLSNRFQFEAQAELGVAGEAEGASFGELQAGILYSPYDSRDLGLALAAGVGMEFPLGALEPDDQFRAVPQLQAYKTLGPIGLNLDVMAEVTVATRSSAGFEEPTVGAALGATWARWESFFPLIEARVRSGAENRQQLSAGVVAEPAEALQLGLAFVVTRENAQNDPGVFGNLTYTLGQ
jgi:hypothetical protein